jgi:hypothetical protein
MPGRYGSGSKPKIGFLVLVRKLKMISCGSASEDLWDRWVGEATEINKGAFVLN